MSSPDARVVSIIGRGGIGKTALASKFLGDVERGRAFPGDTEVDGIVYMSTKTSEITLERLFFDCAQMLGGAKERELRRTWAGKGALEYKIQLLLDHLSDHLYLLLWDNLEDLLDDRGRLVDEGLRMFFEMSLRSPHASKLLVTTRETLWFPDDVGRFDRRVKLTKGLPAEEGAELLRELDPNNDAGLRDASQEKLREISEHLYGVPRALELLAGILKESPLLRPDAVLDSFYSQERVVEELVREGYRHFSVGQRYVLASLAVFSRPVSPSAVAFMLKDLAAGIDAYALLSRLVAMNIVATDDQRELVHLHPVDQAIALRWVEDESEVSLSGLHERAAAYWLSQRKDPTEWIDLPALNPQLFEFEHRVNAKQYEEAARIVRDISVDYLLRQGHNRIVKDMCTPIRDHVRDAPLNMRIHLPLVGHVRRRGP